MGRRISKTVNSLTGKYVYDGENVIADYDGNNNLLAIYVTPFTDENLLVTRYSPLATMYYFMQDGLGSVRNLVNSAESAVNTYDYNAFGESLSATEGVTNRYKYTGREWDTESQTYYYRARQYNPATGRFLSRDPAEDIANLNLYTYVRNNPVNMTDPLGLEEEEDSGIWGWVKAKFKKAKEAVKEGVKKTGEALESAAKTVTEVIVGASAEIATIETFGAYKDPSNLKGSTGYQVGQAIGRAYEATLGIAETAVGVGGMVGLATVELASGGTMTVVVVTVAPAPVALTVHGVAKTAYALGRPPIGSETSGSEAGGGGSSGKGAQMKKLSDQEVKALEKKTGQNIHDIKKGYFGGKGDLYKDDKGNVFIKPKGGAGTGESTGYNLNK